MPTSENDVIELLARADIPPMSLDREQVVDAGRRVRRRRRATGIGVAAAGVVLAGAGYLALGPGSPFAQDDLEPADPPQVSTFPDAQDELVDLERFTLGPVEAPPESLTLARTDGELTVTFVGGEASGEPTEAAEGPAGTQVFQDGEATMYLWPIRYDDVSLPAFDAGEGDLDLDVIGPMAMPFSDRLHLGEQSFGFWYAAGVPEDTTLLDVVLRAPDGGFSTSSGAPVDSTAVDLERGTVDVLAVPESDVVGMCADSTGCLLRPSDTMLVSSFGGELEQDGDIDHSTDIVFGAARVPDEAEDLQATASSSVGDVAGQMELFDLGGMSIAFVTFPAGEVDTGEEQVISVDWTTADGTTGRIEGVYGSDPPADPGD